VLLRCQFEGLLEGELGHAVAIIGERIQPKMSFPLGGLVRSLVASPTG
jgi:hypothetical protein